MTTKIFTVAVLDETTQSLNIMDIKGYSHFGQAYKAFRAGHSLTVRDAIILGWTSKRELQTAVKNTLGNSYWPGLNIVEVYGA